MFGRWATETLGHWDDGRVGYGELTKKSEEKSIKTKLHRLSTEEAKGVTEH